MGQLSCVEISTWQFYLIFFCAGFIIAGAISSMWAAASYRRGLIMLAGYYFARIKRHGPPVNPNEKAMFDFVQHLLHKN